MIETAAWKNYMMSHETLRLDIRKTLTDLARAIGPAMNKGDVRTVNITMKGKLENGESIIGYQYLNGTDANVGGFRINGTARKSSAHFCIVQFNLRYQWNDKIDPNPQYTSDVSKSEFANLISLGLAEDYIVRINWSEVSNFDQNPDRSLGWPFQRHAQ